MEAKAWLMVSWPWTVRHVHTGCWCLATMSIIDVAMASLDEGVLRHCEDGVMGTVMSRASSPSSYGLDSL